MDAQAQSGLIEQFINVTGTTTDRARFFLECAGWNCDIALENFYESAHEEGAVESDSDDEAGFSIDPPTAVAPLEPWSPEPTIQSIPETFPSNSKPTASNKSRFATLGSLKKAKESSDEEEGQAFYAGGSESGGGQQILGPKKKDSTSMVADMFKNAKEHGAETLERSRLVETRSRPAYFQGAAYRLGGENDPGGAIHAAALPGGRPPALDVVLRFWKDGFSVDGGPLRDFQDPANKEFLEDIKQGKIPKELVHIAKGGTVTLDMEDHSNEEYVKPKVTLQAFSGQGFRLGNPTDSTSSHVLLSTSGTSVDQKSTGTDDDSPTSAIQVDLSQPITNIQIRLPDGSRLVNKFNHSHTVSDIRRFIVESRPNYSRLNFVLMTTFPSNEITDECVSLSSANLINAVVVVRMK